MANNQCKECGCICNKCASSHDVQLHVEIENLKQRLVEREHHINTIETTFLNEANKFPNGEYYALREEILTWQDKYSRLYEAHKRVQKVNQSLEDKLLKLVDKTETEKATLTKDVATLSHKLADANYANQRLQDDNDKLKNDVNLAIQLLQCKPTNFVSHRVDSLPNEVQAKVSSYVASRRKPVEDKKPASEIRSIKVPIPTFPPTAMVYSIPKNPSPEKDSNSTNDMERPQVDVVSAAIMAKILEERERERSCTKHCDSCTCSKNSLPSLINDLTHHSVSTQTGNKKNSLCLKCNSDLERSPLGMKIIKSCDSRTVPNNDNDTSTKTYPQNIAYLEVDDTNINITCGSNKVAVSENSKVFVNSFTDAYSKSIPKPALDPKSGHHRLCDQNLHGVINVHGTENDKSKKLGLKINGNENVKGPRYCSMLLQSGSKNILLDNIHNNYAPVIYTRQGSTEKKCKKETADKNLNTQIYESSHTGSISSDDKNLKSLNLSEGENSMAKQLRIAEWVQNIDENEASGSENSKIEHSKSIIELEVENIKCLVKSDLLLKTKSSESEQIIIRKISNEKPKYQCLPQTDGSVIELNKSNNSHTETEI